MIVRKRLRAGGRVQGVFFRDSVRRAADARGVAGWAANLPDGTVEVVLEGDERDVDALVQAVRESPGSSRVESVEVADEEPEGLRGFETR